LILPLFFILQLSLPNYSHTLSLLLPKYHFGKHVFIVNYFLTFDKRFFFLKILHSSSFPLLQRIFTLIYTFFYFVSTTFSPKSTLVFMKNYLFLKRKYFSLILFFNVFRTTLLTNVIFFRIIMFRLLVF